MKVIKKICVAALLTGMVAAGCDKSTPDLSANVRPVPPTPPAPTTAELESGPRHTISLVAAPLCVSAPAGWDIKQPKDGSFVLLHGGAPHGDVDIQVSPIVLPPHSLPIDQSQIDARLAAAKKEMEQNPVAPLLAEVRQIGGGVQLLEEVQADSAATQPADAVCIWRVAVFVPRGKQFSEVSLSFLGLAMSQYNQDGPFLRSILNSLSADDSVPTDPNLQTLP